VWKGFVTNDTFHALRMFTRTRAPRRRSRRTEIASYRSRRLAPPSAEGRWSLVPRTAAAADKADLKVRTTSTGVVQASRPAKGDATKWAASLTQQLLARHGVLTREAVASENAPGGFGIVYPVLKAMEDTGRIRRGYFVAGLGATQFAMPGALDLLRSLRDAPDDPEVAVLAATDPANPYGATLRWPSRRSTQTPQTTQSTPRESGSGGSADSTFDVAGDAGRGPTRTVGATVILVNGALAAYLARGDRLLVTFLPEAEPERGRTARAIALVLIERARDGGDAPRGMLIEEIDGVPSREHPLAPFLAAVGFVMGALGMQATLRRLHPAVENRQAADRGSQQSTVDSRQSTTDASQAKAGNAHSAISNQSEISNLKSDISRHRRSTVSSPFASRYYEPEPPEEES
jgi:ATP-dependent Lhr-like helicase